MDFHRRFLSLLDARGITAYRLAKDTGISERVVGYWKDGSKSPSMENIIKLARYFEVSTDYLLGESDVPRYFYIVDAPDGSKSIIATTHELPITPEEHGQVERAAGEAVECDPDYTNPAMILELVDKRFRELWEAAKRERIDDQG